MLLLSLFLLGGAGLLLGEQAGYYPMDTTPLPDAEKKRTTTGGWKRFVRDVLLKPTTWKAAAAALDFGLKLVRVGAKVWELFE